MFFQSVNLLRNRGNAVLSVNQDVFTRPPSEVFHFKEPRDLNTSAVEIKLRQLVQL